MGTLLSKQNDEINSTLPRGKKGKGSTRDLETRQGDLLPGSFPKGDKKKSLSFKKRIRRHYTNWAAKKGLIDPCRHHGHSHTHSQAPTKPSSLVLARKEYKERMEDLFEEDASDIDKGINDDIMITKVDTLEKEDQEAYMDINSVSIEIKTAGEYIPEDDIEDDILITHATEEKGVLNDNPNEENKKDPIYAIEEQIEVVNTNIHSVKIEVNNTFKVQHPKEVDEPEMLQRIVCEQKPLSEIARFENDLKLGDSSRSSEQKDSDNNNPTIVSLAIGETMTENYQVPEDDIKDTLVIGESIPTADTFDIHESVNIPSRQMNAQGVDIVDEVLVPDSLENEVEAMNDNYIHDIIQKEVDAWEISEEILNFVIAKVVSNEDIDLFEPEDNYYRKSWDEEDTWEDYINEDTDLNDLCDDKVKGYLDFEIGVWNSALWTSDMKQECIDEVIEETIGWGVPFDKVIDKEGAVGFFAVGDDASENRDSILWERRKNNSEGNESDLCESPVNSADDSISTDEGIVATDDEEVGVTNLKKILVLEHPTEVDCYEV